MENAWQVFPESFLERLKKIIPPEKYEDVLASFCQKRPTTLRANTLKISPAELQSELAKSEVSIEPVSGFENAFVLKNVSLYQLSQHELYKNGSLYVQSLSSMLPPLILSPQPGERILDLTAAPGSKTTQMAAMMSNEGEITANDLSLVRLFKLQANLKMQGVTNTYARRGPGQHFWQKYPEYFDKTLIDAPCTMEGRFACDDPKTYDDWSMKKIKELSIRQCHLLRSAVSATKVGGTIVYSTCTLAPEENEQVVDWLLRKENGGVELVDIELGNIPTSPAVMSWEKKTFLPEIGKTVRILPSAPMEGFFVAKLQKTRSTIGPQVQMKKRRFHRR